MNFFQAQAFTFLDNDKKGTAAMLRYALMFLVLALIAGFLGLGGVAAVSVEIAKILFMVFLALFVVALVVGLVRGKASKI